MKKRPKPRQRRTKKALTDCTSGVNDGDFVVDTPPTVVRSRA
jgi:hypothetical protein